MRLRSCLAAPPPRAWGHWSWGIVLCASCAGPHVPSAGFGRGTVAATAPATAAADAGATTVAPSPPPPPPPAAEWTDAAELERHWRNQLATAADPAPAARELAALLAELERHGDALAAIDTVLPRTDNPTLRIVRAGLLRDLGQRHLAVAELRAVVTAHGAAALHPGMRFELAELEWLEGNANAASAVLDALAREPADAAWCDAHAGERQALATEIAAGRRPTKVRVRDLLGNLRGAPLATTRIAVLERLVAGGGVPAPDAQRLRERALAIAAGDESAAVRARAVNLVPPEAEFAAEFFDVALADEAPLVRRTAAARAAVALGAEANELLLRHLASEGDETVFVALDRALASLVRDAVALGPGDAATPERRAQVVARWRARWPSSP